MKLRLHLQAWGLGILLFSLFSCANELSINVPEGPAGKSAYEVWKESVLDGTVEWDKSRTDLVDFFAFLKGKDGADGKSAYDLWVDEVKLGNIEDKDGNPWPKDKTTMQDFWKFLSGADGKNGLTPTIGENGNWWIGETDTGVKAQGPPAEIYINDEGYWVINGVPTDVKATGTSTYELWVEEVQSDDGLEDPGNPGSNWPKDKTTFQDFLNYLRTPVQAELIPEVTDIQTMSKMSVSTALEDDNYSNWVEKTKFSPYEGMLFEPKDAATKMLAKDVQKITMPFWRQRFKIMAQCEGSDFDVVLAGKKDLSGSWIDTDENRTYVEDSTEKDGVYTRVIWISFKANDLTTENERTLTLSLRRKDAPNTYYKDIEFVQVHRPNVLGRYSKWFVKELNRQGAELTEGNIGSLSQDEYGRYYQWGRNIPFEKGVTYAETGEYEKFKTPDYWFTIGTNNIHKTQKADQTWSSKVAEAMTYPGESGGNYQGTNGGDPCPEGWHIPYRTEQYTMFIGWKGNNTVDLFRFNNSNSGDDLNIYEGLVENAAVIDGDQYGIEWDYWYRENSYAHYASTGSDSQSDSVAAFRAYGPIYAIKFMSHEANDVFENALKTAFKYEMLLSEGANPTYYVRVTSRHLGEYSNVEKVSDLDAVSNFWNDDQATYTTALLPLYGSIRVNDSTMEKYFTKETGYWSGDIGNITPGVGSRPSYLHMGGPSSDVDKSNLQTISAEWSDGSENAMLIRCVQNPPDIKLPNEETSLPQWK